MHLPSTIDKFILVAETLVLTNMPNENGFREFIIISKNYGGKIEIRVNKNFPTMSDHQPSFLRPPENPLQHKFESRNQKLS